MKCSWQLVIAILFANNAEALMGSTEDPPDGGAVARTCIGAVIIYAVPTLLALPLTIRYFCPSVDVKFSYIDGIEGLN
jgi:hypothetical protein